MAKVRDHAPLAVRERMERENETSGRALFDMANLWPERTGLPFVVFIPQRGRARHDVRVKLARAARVRPSEMITVAVRPAPHLIGSTMTEQEFDLVRRWIDLNRDVLIDYWEGKIEYTEDAVNAIRSIAASDKASGSQA